MTLDGDVLWQKTYGGEDWDFAYDIEVDDSGDYFIVGETYSTGHGNNDVYLIKVNNAGEVIWDTAYGTAGNEIGRKLTFADNGDLLIIGDQKLEEANTSTAWLLRVDPEGIEIWDFVHDAATEALSHIQASGGWTTTLL